MGKIVILNQQATANQNAVGKTARLRKNYRRNAWDGGNSWVDRGVKLTA
jgi:hypothetical protein